MHDLLLNIFISLLFGILANVLTPKITQKWASSSTKRRTRKIAQLEDLLQDFESFDTRGQRLIFASLCVLAVLAFVGLLLLIIVLAERLQAAIWESHAEVMQAVDEVKLRSAWEADRVAQARLGLRTNFVLFPCLALIFYSAVKAISSASLFVPLLMEKKKRQLAAQIEKLKAK